MTDQFPDATKMVLSPAAQAVIDAYYNTDGYRSAPAIGSALRAAADQWKNEIRKQPNTEFISGIKNCIDALNEVADELEGQALDAPMTENIQLPNGDVLKNYSEVTRVEVITNTGREFVRYECSNVQVSLQDNEQTIKVFLFSTYD